MNYIYFQLIIAEEIIECKKWGVTVHSEQGWCPKQLLEFMISWSPESRSLDISSAGWKILLLSDKINYECEHTTLKPFPYITPIVNISLDTFNHNQETPKTLRFIRTFSPGCCWIPSTPGVPTIIPWISGAFANLPGNSSTGKSMSQTEMKPDTPITCFTLPVTWFLKRGYPATLRGKKKFWRNIDVIELSIWKLKQIQIGIVLGIYRKYIWPDILHLNKNTGN